MFTLMATKTITITESAYKKLKAIKGNRSFSEVIDDIAGREAPDISDSVGLWSGKEGKRAEERVEKFREKFEEDFDEKVGS